MTPEKKRAIRAWLKGLRHEDRAAEHAGEVRDLRLGCLETGGKAGLAPHILIPSPIDGHYPEPEDTLCTTECTTYMMLLESLLDFDRIRQHPRS